MKVAILADIHGNTMALENVLKDAETMGVEEYWFLGDYAAIGYDPVGVLERITSLPNARFIHGNTDRYLVTGELPWMGLEEAIRNLAHARTHVQVARSFAWTAGAVGTTGWLWWFKELPLDFRFTLPDGTRILAVHAAPGTDDGMGININTSNEDLCALGGGCRCRSCPGGAHASAFRSDGRKHTSDQPGKRQQPLSTGSAGLLCHPGCE